MCGARGPGDIIIGVLNACHSKVANLEGRIQAERFNCTGFDLESFVETLAVIHTIDTINDSGFLPGIRLGYLVCDTCSDASKGIQDAIHMLAINQTKPFGCDLIERPLVKAIIGARYSEVSTAVARLLGLYMVPQISATSSANTLDDTLRYPSFLRTIPSDVHQTHALAQLMAHFKWNWVGVVSGDDDYGRAALHDFLKYAEDANVCAAFNEVIPHYLDHPESKQRIDEVATHIQSSDARVVLLILKGQLVEQLFRVMISKGISRTWIATDSWSQYQAVAEMTGINTIGDVFGIRFITGPNPGYEHFLTNLSPGPGAVNRFIEEYKDLRFECTPEAQQHQDCLKDRPADQCPLPDSLKLKSKLACVLPDPQKANDDFLAQAPDQTYAHRLATWSIAFALRSLLQCNTTTCPGERDFKPGNLLLEMKNVNFTLDKRQFYFDKSSLATGYELINWVKRQNKRHFEVIGGYNVTIRTLGIEEKTIEWHTPNKTIPESKCSQSCPPGTFKKISMISCCYNCSECEEGSFTNDSDLPNCLKCPGETWSLRGEKKCYQRTESFLKWDDPFAISLLVVTGIGLLLLFSIFVIFLNKRSSVIFKVAGGEIVFVMMAGLAVSFGAVVLFVSKPTDEICKSRQTVYGLGFTLSVSCILVKAFRTFLAFLFDMNQQHMLNKLYKPVVIVVSGTGIQGLICTFWLIFDAPKVDQEISRQSMKIVLQCNEGSNWGFGIMLSYIALLASICFLLALKGRKVPQRFNETGYIIFSMIIYLFVWVCFIPIYVTKIQQRPAVQASAIVVSNFGIIFCHFFPKCYMMLCKKKHDTDRRSYLKTVHNFSISTISNELSYTPDSGHGSDVENSFEKSFYITDAGASTPKSSRASAMTMKAESHNTGISSSNQIRQRLRAKSL
ncbi:G-protein coupled receptor family C group 6 member A-like isoform X2 [Gadus chalcogrammus]|nr:G-protein coupled receptor family C group 6 member A-like isoform X2 [Gadus chalcogrammus]